MVVVGIEIMVEVITTDQTRVTAQALKMEAMEAVTAPTMVMLEGTTTAMDSQTSATIKLERLPPKTTSRLNNLFPIHPLHKMAQAILNSSSPRARLLNTPLHSILPHRWCRTPCLHSSLSKCPADLKEVIYCILSFKFHTWFDFLYLHNRVLSTFLKPFMICSAAIVLLHTCFSCI